MSLLRRDDSLLLVIDTQEGFYGEGRLDIDRPAFARFVDCVAWVAGTASSLGVPVVVTEEDPGLNGPTSPRVMAGLPVGATAFPKPVFAAGDDPAILAAIEETGRRTVVIAGLETDVCVSHSALSLQVRGYSVAAVSDALFSPSGAHEHGLVRLRAAGVQLLSAKELYYDWVRTVAGARAFTAANPGLAVPPGFSL